MKNTKAYSKILNLAAVAVACIAVMALCLLIITRL